MKLIVFELQDDNIKQQIKVNENDLQVGAIRPHIYRHRAPAGTISMQVQDVNGGIIATSNALTISTLGTLDFFHGQIRFDIEASLNANTVYNIAMRSSGYSFAEAAYVGWCNDYDLQKNERNFELDFSNGGDFDAALLMEVWERVVLPKNEEDC